MKSFPGTKWNESVDRLTDSSEIETSPLRK